MGYKQLRDAVGGNPRFGSPISKDFVRSLLDELKPQFGSLHYDDPAGTVIPLTAIPQKLTLFTAAQSFNGQIDADDATDTITIENTNVEDEGYYEQFGAGLTGVGLVAEGHINVAFESLGANIIYIELYVGGVATGIRAAYRTQGVERQAPEFFRVALPNDSVCEYYVYSDGASFNATFYQLNVDLQKLSLGVEDDAVDAVTPLSS